MFFHMYMCVTEVIKTEAKVGGPSPSSAPVHKKDVHRAVMGTGLIMYSGISNPLRRISEFDEDFLNNCLLGNFQQIHAKLISFSGF